MHRRWAIALAMVLGGLGGCRATGPDVESAKARVLHEGGVVDQASLSQSSHEARRFVCGRAAVEALGQSVRFIYSISDDGADSLILDDDKAESGRNSFDFFWRNYCR